MGKIVKLQWNNINGGTDRTDIYPITSDEAVYNSDNKTLRELIKVRGVVNISTYFSVDGTPEVLTLEKAIAKITEENRCPGFLATILTEDGWYTYRYNAEPINDTPWFETKNWSVFNVGDFAIESTAPLHLSLTLHNYLYTLRGYIDAVNASQDGYMSKEDYIKFIDALKNIDDIFDRLTTDENRITNTENRLTSAESRITATENKLSDDDKRMDSIENNVSSNTGRITTIEGNITTINNNITSLEQEITDESTARLNSDNELSALISTLQDKLIYFDDHFVCKANDSEGYLNWDRDNGIYFNDAHFGDMWNTAAGADSMPLCFVVTSNGITYQYCIDAKTGRAYYRYGEFGEDALIDLPWIPVGNLEESLFIFVKELPTEDIDDTKIYCIPNEDSTDENNIFDEYYYANGKWEEVGKYIPKVDLSDYYNKEQANDLFATKDDIPTKVSQLTNDAEYVDNTSLTAILTEYAKLTDIPVIPTNVSAFVNDAGYITEDALNGYAKESDIPTVPTNVSAFTNDAGYITKDDITNPDLSDYVKQGDLCNDSTADDNFSKLVSNIVGATKAAEGMQTVDITVDRVPEAPEVTAKDLWGYIYHISGNVDLSDYCTTDYLTDNYYTKTYITANYYNKQDIQNLIGSLNPSTGESGVSSVQIVGQADDSTNILNISPTSVQTGIVAVNIGIAEDNLKAWLNNNGYNEGEKNVITKVSAQSNDLTGILTLSASPETGEVVVTGGIDTEALDKWLKENGYGSTESTTAGVSSIKVLNRTSGSIGECISVSPTTATSGDVTLILSVDETTFKQWLNDNGYGASSEGSAGVTEIKATSLSDIITVQPTSYSDGQVELCVGVDEDKLKEWLDDNGYGSGEIVTGESLSSSSYYPSTTAKLITGTIDRSSVRINRPNGTASSMKGHEIHMIFKANMDTTVTIYTSSAMVAADGVTSVSLSEGEYVEISIICDGVTFYTRTGVSNAQ